MATLWSVTPRRPKRDDGKPDHTRLHQLFGLDPNYTPEEIQRIEVQARAADGDTQATADTQVPQTQAPQTQVPEIETTKKRKRREKTTSKFWQYFTRGETREDGFYDATCKFCGHVYEMGNQRGTGSLMHHFKKSCEKVPKSLRKKPDALQKLLQAGTTIAPAIEVWSFDQMKSRKGLARMVKAPDKKPAWDVQTRWNSTYLMLQLAFELKQAIESFIVDMGKEMYAKWDKYWAGGNMLLAIACVFDPRSKLGVVEYYIKEMYPNDYESFMANLNHCINALFKDYEEAYNRLSREEVGSSSQQVRQAGSASSRESESDTRAGLKDYLKNKKRVDPKKSELEEYLTDALDENSLDVEFDILSWWKLKAAKYPILSRLTRDILAVPISTVASESTFSNSGRTLSPIRSSLNDESIEALICAQDWLRASVTEIGGDFGEVLWSVDEAVPDPDGTATN
ncbi:Zinc finger BED domain-containing protein DAYSLEEPER [Rhynchospora pubera]|uniref:Zinc finger BED domain-containing protein DAYSLEEPER n=1 Tax=Rhynchospora pubera TaxID=906938 RepID=A0AAV8BRY7_9POAL|nr:Zinc finger BED domain-containing protein DAYSLEEPER [Rhynchospora pubera]